MTITSPPTAAAVRIESRLRPEQVNPTLADAAALEADIAARITKYKAVIDRKLSTVEDTATHQIIAAEALMLRVLASLFGSAGALNPAYWERAQALKAESADLLDDLTGGDTVTSVEMLGTTLSTAPYRFNADGVLVDNV